MASPVCHSKESPVSMAAASPSSPQLFSPSSDKRFWSTLRTRVDTILEARNGDLPSPLIPQAVSGGGSNRSKRLKQDSLLLLRGFDSIASTLSQLTSNLDNALQGARDLSKPPTFTEILHSVSAADKSDSKVDEPEKSDENDEQKVGVKRKFELEDCSDDDVNQAAGGSAGEENHQKSQVDEKMKNAKNLAASMAAKAAWLSREMKSVKSDLCFMQDRCALLEEENRRLRDGFVTGIRPEEDDLVRLQLEALLAEKSRLANENANLTRENECLRQLVEYHQFAAQDSSTTSYEQVMDGLSLDFASPARGLNDLEGAETQTTDFEFPVCLE
nr:immunoglobulin G-binding protein H-like protein [Fagopyrum tataricum]